jgi:hypothetical protein
MTTDSGSIARRGITPEDQGVQGALAHSGEGCSMRRVHVPETYIMLGSECLVLEG